VRHETEIRHLLEALPTHRTLPYRGVKIERIGVYVYLVNNQFMGIADAAREICKRRVELKAECRQMAFFESLRN